MKGYQLMIHGGCGDNINPDKFHKTLEDILIYGGNLLSRNLSALDVVEKVSVELENSTLFNAGKGSVLTHDGEIEMDAAIMDGLNLNCGSALCVQGIKNPISLARRIMEKSEHVILSGKGAQEFAKDFGFKIYKKDHFLTKERIMQWENAKKHNKVVLDHSNNTNNEEKFGTIGAIARDNKGNLAATTSTGGIVNKKYNRVGDSPIIGAGVYADNETCAVSTTGYGEQFLKIVAAKHASDIIKYKSLSAQETANETIKYLVTKVKGLGGIIIIDKFGNFGSAFSTKKMIHGYITSNKIKILT
jgi:beta-aspartyl-peptidase (threonine type)